LSDRKGIRPVKKLDVGGDDLTAAMHISIVPYGTTSDAQDLVERWHTGHGKVH